MSTLILPRLLFLCACLWAGAHPLLAQQAPPAPALRLQGDTEATLLTRTADGIHSSQSLGPNAAIRYHAGHTIALTAGFRVAPGASFEAIVLPQAPVAEASAASAKQADETGAFSLEVFPQPADQAVELRLTLPEAAATRVEVFDMAMRRVAVLDGPQRAPGTHVWTLETGRWPAGSYLLHLQSGAHAETRHIVVQH